MGSGRVIVLEWVNIVGMYTMYVMMEYLTKVWKLGFTQAAAIVNIFWCTVSILPLFLLYVVDSIMGDYRMLLISTFAYSVGLGFLTMSTPPVLANAMGTCSDYKPECVGHGQKILLYTAMPLVALGFSGLYTSCTSFLSEQVHGELEELDRDDVGIIRWIYNKAAALNEELEELEGFIQIFSWIFYKIIALFLSVFSVFVVIAAVLVLPYIKPWSIRFGIPAICTLVATLLFLSGSFSYKCVRPQGSPLTMFFRVFVAASSKLFYRIPKDAKELYETKNPEVKTVPHKISLRCLDKAAIVIPLIPLEEQEKNKWKLCRVTEVEETKGVVRMVPVWMTFIFCGIVSAIGLTYFVEQLSHMNQKVGRLKVPTVVLLWFYEESKILFTALYLMFADFFGVSRQRKFAPSFGIAVSMILAILCCITASKVENRRLGVVQKHGLVDKPDETVPMTMFWLLPQFLLLGAFNGVFQYSAISFSVDQFPVSTRSYLPFCITALSGVGILGSVLSVFIVGKVSERGGKTNWFQHDLNGSRLDKYFLTLAWLMAINLAIFIIVAILYRYNESELEDEEEEIDGIIELMEVLAGRL